MADLQEQAEWTEGIYQLETTDPVEGGADGIDNRQAKQLANRTAFLKKQHKDYLASRVGEIGEFHLAANKPGWLDLKGGEISRTVDQLLWDYANTSGLVVAQATKDADPMTYAMYFGDGDGSTTFTLPNHHLGHFVRGTPSGVAHGQTQGDAIRNITGNWRGDFEGLSNGHQSTFDGALYTDGTTQPASHSGTADNIQLMHLGFDASRTVPTADENRPYTANLSIKIYRGWMY